MTVSERIRQVKVRSLEEAEAPWLRAVIASQLAFRSA